MCRFGSLKTSAIRSRSALSRIVRRLPRKSFKPACRINGFLPGAMEGVNPRTRSQSRRKAERDADLLRFDSIDARLMSLKTAQEKLPCFSRKSQYKDWLDAESCGTQRFFGSRKSRYWQVHYYEVLAFGARKAMKNFPIVISFFNAEVGSGESTWNFTVFVLSSSSRKRPNLTSSLDHFGTHRFNLANRRVANQNAQRTFTLAVRDASRSTPGFAISMLWTNARG